MSKVAELVYDIQELFIDGMGAKQISQELGCPMDTVLQVLESFGVDAEDMDYADEFDPFGTVNS